MVPSLRRWTMALALVALLGSGAAAETPQHHAYGHGFESFRAHMEDPARAQWQKPDDVVQALRLQGGERVADIGAGTGYFTVLLARAVGTPGRVYAVDIDKQAVQYMRRRFEREKLRQATAIQGTPADPKLPGRVDLIFICDTWHHIENRGAYLRVLRRHLTKTGRVVIVDFKPDADPSIGPPKEMRLSRQQVIDELQRGGFRIAEEPDFLPLQYVLIAAPATDSAAGR
jgi:ubiquinone/menaquinone biosynthesis C-methylase UbiE